MKIFDYESATLLIVGGGSIASWYATKLAKLAGLEQIVVVGGTEEILKGYGCTSIVDCMAKWRLSMVASEPSLAMTCCLRSTRQTCQKGNY